MILQTRFFQIMLLASSLAVYIYLPVWSVGHALSNNDFKHLYLGMKALLDGNSPYPIQSLHHQAALQGYHQISLNPYVYLPFTGYCMAFLAPFNLGLASFIWFAVNHLLALAVVYLLSGLYPRWRVGAAAVLTLAFALNVPYYRTLSAGQLNIPLLFLVCIGFHFRARQVPRVVGIVLAIATLFKLMPGIYGGYFILKRQFKLALVMMVSGLVLAVIMVFAAGPKITLEFLPVLKQMSYGRSTWPWVFSFWDDPPNQSLNSFFTHVLAQNEHTTPWLNLGQTAANTATVLVTVFLVLCWATMALRCRSLTHQFSTSDQAGWCATLLLGLLIPSLMWDHYLVMLIFPVSWMITQAYSKKKPGAVVLAASCFVITAIPWNFEAMEFRTGAGIILMSLKLWPTLLLFGLSLCFMRWSCENVAMGTLEDGEPDAIINP